MIDPDDINTLAKQLGISIEHGMDKDDFMLHCIKLLHERNEDLCNELNEVKDEFKSIQTKFSCVMEATRKFLN